MKLVPPGLRHRRTGPFLLLGLLLFGGCSEPPTPVVAVSTSERFLDAARLAVADAAPDGRAPVDTIIVPSDINVSGPAIGQAEEFAAVPGMLAVIGHSNSAASLAASQIYNEVGIVQIAPHSSAVIYSRAGPWSFRLVPPDDGQAEFLVGQLATLLPDGGGIAVLYVNDDYGRGLLTGFRAAVDTERYPLLLEYPHTEEEGGQPDVVEATVESLADARPALVVWLGRAPVLDISLGPLRERLPDTPVLGSDGISAGHQYPNDDGRWTGVHHVGFVDMDATPALRDFTRHYEERFGIPPSGPDALTYDAMDLVLTAFRDGARTPEGLRSWLMALGRDRPPHPGVTGSIRFDERGDVEPSYVLLTIG